MKKYLLIFILLFSIHASALSAYKWKRLIGWEVVDVKTIAGWEDEDGEKGDSFEGCDWDRKIIFTDDTYLVCTSYNYSYSYRPDAVIFERYGSYKILVNNEFYDMSR